MEVDQQLLWFQTALKPCVSCTDLDDKKLNRYITDCLIRVKSSISSGNKEQLLEDFKHRITLVLLLCCPCIRAIPAVQNSKDFQSVLLTFPELSESIFFSVVRNQKLYRYVCPLLSCLPSSTLSGIVSKYFATTKQVTPVTLAISLELVKALIYNIQNTAVGESSVQEYSEVWKQVLEFHSQKRVEAGPPAVVKSNAYFFMYLCECTYLIANAFIGKYIDSQTTSKVIQGWTDLFYTKSDEMVKEKLVVYDVLKSFLLVCQENIEGINVDMWMGWSEINLPTSVTVHRRSITSQIRPQENTIQSVICNIAFDILKSIEFHSSGKDFLQMYSALTQFWKQIAADPDYDPDQDLERDQLLSEINLRTERRSKLVNLLLQKEYFFTCNESIDCILTHCENVERVNRLLALTKLINLIQQGKPYNKKAIEMVLKLAEDLPAAELLHVIKNQLSSGQDEILKTSDFHQQMTAVFNQLTDDNSCKNYTKLVWLCLQSGQAVVNEAVRLPLAFPGLVSVMVQALASIPQVCQAVGKSEVPVLVYALQERQRTELLGRERQDFCDLVKGVIRADIVNCGDILHLIVQPTLNLCNLKDLSTLDIPIELLRIILQHKKWSVLQPGVELVSLVIILLHVIDATAVFHNQNISFTLKLRSDALLILHAIVQAMRDEPEKYERDVSMLKQMIVKYSLHPRSVVPLMDILDCYEESSSTVDCLLTMILKVHLQQWEGKPLKIGSVGDLPRKLQESSKEEWMVMLCQLLPHCSEEEWIITFYVLHEYLQSGYLACYTMDLIQKVLYLIDMQSKSASSCDVISLQHCFKCFASASMVYLEEVMKDHPYSKKFSSLCSISMWWCQVLPLYTSGQEVSVLFLMQLVMTIEEMLNRGDRVLIENKNDLIVTDNCENSSGTNKKKDKSVAKNTEVNGITQREDNELYCSETDNINNVVTKMSALQVDLASDNLCEKKLEVSVDADDLDVNLKKNEKVSSLPHHKITKEEFKKEIEEVSLVFLKFVPTSNLASSVAGKLKKLLEMS